MPCALNGQLQLFDEDCFRDAPWDLAYCDAALSEAEYPLTVTLDKTGELDISDAGKVEIRFVEQLQQQLHLMGVEAGWDLPGLTNWLDRQIPHPDLTRTQATLFIHRVLNSLIESAQRPSSIWHGSDSGFNGRSPSESTSSATKFRGDSYNRMLFSTDRVDIEVSPELYLELTEDRYAPNWYYEGSYRFQHHLFRPIGELKPQGEEFECAVFLDQLPQVKWWVRNLERRADYSFWLQTSTDKFYPDFVALLNDGRIMIVEYERG